MKKLYIIIALFITFGCNAPNYEENYDDNGTSDIVINNRTNDDFSYDFKGLTIDGDVTQFNKELASLEYTKYKNRQDLFIGMYGGCENCFIRIYSTPNSHLVSQLSVYIPLLKLDDELFKAIMKKYQLSHDGHQSENSQYAAKLSYADLRNGDFIEIPLMYVPERFKRDNTYFCLELINKRNTEIRNTEIRQSREDRTEALVKQI